VVYDVTKPETLKSVNEWLELIYGLGPTDVSFMLVGNKTDLKDLRSVSSNEGQVNLLNWIHDISPSLSVTVCLNIHHNCHFDFRRLPII